MTTTKESKTARLNATIAARAAADQHGYSEAEILTRLADDSDTSPHIATLGACAVCLLRRRAGRGWRVIGYAVWSCRQQGYVRGSWRHPLTSISEACQAMRDVGYDG